MLTHQHTQCVTSHRDLYDLMQNTPQCEGVNVYEHGQMVHKKYTYLKSYFNLQTMVDPYDIPEELFVWYWRNHHKILPEHFTSLYHIFHDCGKPLCIVYDEHGRKHFPNHAEISAEQYGLIYPNQKIIQQLIRMDMDFHTLKGDNLTQLWKHELAPTLYITAWAELFANADMFGGIESTSFKIKKKQLMNALKKYNQLYPNED